MKTCSTCRYFSENSCHRYPPTVVSYVDSSYDRVMEQDSISTSTNSEYPSVQPTNWCGEHRHTPETDPALNI
jgi:hypothetical protein